MTKVAWRIATDTPDYTAEDLSGAGAKITGGRWNRQNTPLVYSATTIALACLETIVHLNANALPLNRYLVRIDVPDNIWAKGNILASPAVGWDALPAGRVSLDYGTSWCTSKASLLLFVPSTIVPEEMNVLINPEHPDAGLLSATKVRKWTYDARIRP